MMNLLFMSLLAATNFSEQMSLEEMEQTGVAKLTPVERSLLENWIEKHCQLHCQAQKEITPTNITLHTNLEGGRRLELSDGHIYEVAPEDLLISSSWLTPFPLKIEESYDPNYPLQLVNIHTGRVVKVKRIS